MAVNFFDNFNIQTDKPIDIRMTVATHADLYAATSYSDGLYAYKGMLVTVLVDETGGFQPQTYILTSTKSGYTNSVNWRRFAIGANDIGDLDDVMISNPEPGDILVYNPSGTSGYWQNIGPVVENILPYSGTDAAGFIVIKTDGTSELIVINEIDDTVAFATQTTAGTVELSDLDDIITGNDAGQSGAVKVTRPSDVRAFVIENRDLVYPPPTATTDIGEVGTWSYDEYYIYWCIPNAGTNGTSGNGNIWKRTRIELW